MKKLLAFAIIGTLCFSAKAQFQFGFQGGATFSNIKVKDEDTTVKGNMVPGFKFGILAKIPFSESFAFMPELNFLSKGFKHETTETFFNMTYTYKSKVNLMYIELPLNFAYTAKIGNGQLFAGLGPVVSFGITGTSKYEQIVNGEKESETTDVKFDGDDDAIDDDAHLNRVDLGANVFAGYQLSNGIFAKLLFNQSISDLIPEKDTKGRINYFGFTIGYMLGSKK